MSDLHAQIMNLPCKSTHLSYKRGHRDARHAAAELAGEEIDRLEQQRDELLAAMKDLCEQIEDTEEHGGDASEPECPICDAIHNARHLIVKAESAA